ncbi:hypothetical protein PFISCL1PPCAC_4522, partial [Pristionchus fissidentatus]
FLYIGPVPVFSIPLKVFPTICVLPQSDLFSSIVSSSFCDLTIPFSIASTNATASHSSSALSACSGSLFFTALAGSCCLAAGTVGSTFL